MILVKVGPKKEKQKLLLESLITFCPSEMSVKTILDIETQQKALLQINSDPKR